MAKTLQSISVGIVGLGLIGGSIARALGEKGGIKNIVAVGRNEQALKGALVEQVINCMGINDYSVLKDCDVVYICTPVGKIVPTVMEVSKYCTGVITDAGSTKVEIIKEIENLMPEVRFVGGHPMAGSEKFGFTASSARLYENAPYVICPSKKASKQDVELITQLAACIGACPIVMQPAEHDRAVGLISHLPHVAAYSLVNIVADNDKGSLRTLAAGGFKDITRIASSSPEMWTDIVQGSGQTLVKLLDEYIKYLQGFRELLINNDKSSINDYFTKDKEYRDSVPSQGKHVQLWVEVDDRPGVIGRIAGMFGERGINIKNIHIEDSREYEGGCLRISLKNESDAQLAAELLIADGLQCSLRT